MASPLPQIKAKFFTKDGSLAPLAGGKVFTYVAGTVATPLASYTDFTGNVANTNPVILDSYGEANIWLNGNYKILVQDSAGNQVYLQDNIQDIASFVSSTYANVLNFWAGTAAGSPNVLTLSPSPALTSYTVGQTIRFLIFQDNTGGATLAVNALSAIPIRKFNGSGLAALAAGDLKANMIAEVEYDGTQFQLLNVRPYAHGIDVASATSVNLDVSSGDLVDITGTTAITGITLADGQERTVRFTGILILTNGANLVLLSGANITTAAGDFAVFRGYPMGVVRMVGYSRANGTALIAPPQIAKATAAQVKAEAADVYMDPAFAYNHPALPKAWVFFNGTTGAIIKAYKVSAVVRNSAGNYTITFPAMGDINYLALLGCRAGGATTVDAFTEFNGGIRTTTQLQVGMVRAGAGAADVIFGSVAIFGDLP